MSAPDDPGRAPATCPECGQDLSPHPYYRLVPPPAARVLQRIAAALLPLMGIVYVVFLFWGDSHFGFGTGHGYAAVVVIATPSLLLYGISRLLPRRRLVMCLRCSWNREYPDHL